MDLFTIKAAFSSEMSWFGQRRGREDTKRQAVYSSHWLRAVSSWPVRRSQEQTQVYSTNVPPSWLFSSSSPKIHSSMPTVCVLACYEMMDWEKLFSTDDSVKIGFWMFFSQSNWTRWDCGLLMRGVGTTEYNPRVVLWRSIFQWTDFEDTHEQCSWEGEGTELQFWM